MKTRILVSALIVIQWGLCAGAEAEKTNLTGSSQVEYYKVLMEGAKVGHATRSRLVTGGQVRTTETVDITMQRMGIELSVKTAETCVETRNGEPISFTSAQDMGIMQMNTEGIVGKDGMVIAKTAGAGGAQETSFPWPAGALMSEGLRLLEIEKGLKAGVSYSAKVFIPSMLGAIDANLRVAGKEEVDLFGRFVNLTRIETTMSMPGTGQTTSISYVDDRHNQLKTIVPMMDMRVEMIACEKEIALGGNDYFDIGDKMFLASPEPIDDAAGAKAIGYILKTTGQGDFTLPSSDNQRVKKLEDGSVMVVVEPVSMPKGGTFPYKGNDAEIVEATRPSRFLQSDDPKIKELARQAIGDAKDAGEAAKRIEAFVAGYIENKSLSVGYASASEAAASRKGDCSEFAVLCAAMCRAAGIPARVVVGVAYVNDFMGRSGFGGHAWVEAYIEGKWVGLDSAFKAGGRGGFDASHIAFAWGDGEPLKFFNVATTMGRFKIEKVIVERGN